MPCGFDYALAHGARGFGELRRRLRQRIAPKKRPFKGSKAAKKASRRRA